MATSSNYPHEAAFKKALAKVYYLTDKSGHKGRTMADIGPEAGAALANLARGSKPKPVSAEPKASTFTGGSEFDSIRGGNSQYDKFKEASYANSPAGLQQSAFQPPNQVSAAVAKDAISNLAKRSIETNRSNEAAAQTRFGGKFSEAGLQMAHDNATIDAQDRMRARQMIVRQMGPGYGMQELPMSGYIRPEDRQYTGQEQGNF